MWHLLYILSAAAVVTSALVCSNPSFSVRGAETILLRNYASGLKDGKPFTNYEHGVGWRALEMVFNATGDVRYKDHIKSGADNIVTSEGDILDYDLTYYTLDDVRVGESLIYL
jgi:rhamnogalacturonyl hydrolase YesR